MVKDQVDWGAPSECQGDRKEGTGSSTCENSHFHVRHLSVRRTITSTMPMHMAFPAVFLTQGIYPVCLTQNEGSGEGEVRERGKDSDILSKTDLCYVCLYQ